MRLGKWIFYGLILLLMSASPACSEKTSGKTSGDSPPRIMVEKDTLDFGTVMEGEKTTSEFRVKNQGGAVLEISRVKTT